jgi:hypothetical protein
VAVSAQNRDAILLASLQICFYIMMMIQVLIDIAGDYPIGIVATLFPGFIEETACLLYIGIALSVCRQELDVCLLR